MSEIMGFKEFLDEALISILESDDEKFSSKDIDLLKNAWSGVKKINPSSPTYKKMKAKIDGMSTKKLKQIFKAKVNFISQMASAKLLSMGLSPKQIREDVTFKKTKDAPKVGKRQKTSIDLAKKKADILITSVVGDGKFTVETNNGINLKGPGIKPLGARKDAFIVNRRALDKLRKEFDVQTDF